MGDSVKLNFMTDRAGEPPAGYDSTIVQVPADRWYEPAEGAPPSLLVAVAGADLRRLSEGLAENLGETLHSGRWTLTGDPAEVRTLGLMHDCPTCRAGVDQALTFLRENPGAEVAVGQLWWAQPAPGENR